MKAPASRPPAQAHSVANDLTLRDYFAIHAYVPDEILSDAMDTTPGRAAARAALAQWAYAYADAMLQEREKERRS